MNIPKIEMVPLNKIRPNPWRDFKRNPIDPDKVEQLTESIKATGEFWVGVYGRKVTGGFVELAFGHNRLEAAKAVDTGDAIEAAKAAGLKEIPVALRDFTDGEMLMRMTRENLRGELPVVLEAVSAAVRALAEGKIEIEAPERTNPANIRYAPSFVPGRKPTSPSEGEVKPYTADTLARNLGGIYTKAGSKTEAPRASNSVVAALGILELEEKKIEGFSQRTYGNLSIREIIPMVSDIKQRHIIQVERRGKTQEELNKLREQQLELQRKQKEQERVEEEKRQALLKQQAEARRADNERKQDAIKEKIKAADQRAQEIEATNALRMSEIEEKIKQTKAREAAQKVQDAYAPIRRDVDALITRWETKVSERDTEREQIKALARLKSLRPEDRLRLRKAAMDVSDHYAAWVAPQFAPLPTAQQELKAMSKKEIAKRKADEATALALTEKEIAAKKK